jgi:hypothetical protein
MPSHSLYLINPTQRTPRVYQWRQDYLQVSNLPLPRSAIHFCTAKKLSIRLTSACQSLNAILNEQIRVSDLLKRPSLVNLAPAFATSRVKGQIPGISFHFCSEMRLVASERAEMAHWAAGPRELDVAEDGAAVDGGGEADRFVDDVCGGGVEGVVGGWELGELGVYTCCREHDMGISGIGGVNEDGEADLGC